MKPQNLKRKKMKQPEDLNCQLGVGFHVELDVFIKYYNM